MGPPPSRCRRSAGAWLVLAGVLGALGPSAEASPPGPGVLGLAEDGRVGVFVVSGPYEARKPTGAPATSTGAKLALGDRPSGMPPLALSEALVCAGGDPDPCSRRTTVEIARSGVVDLKERLAPRGEALAYATFTLRTERDFRGFLLLSVDDGVRVSVDGKVIHSRDEGRPPRDDDDAVPLSLSAGRHVVSLELHQHDGPWQVAARIVDEGLARPTGLVVEVPSGAAALAAMHPARIRVTRALDATATKLVPEVRVSFPDGVPDGRELPVTVRVLRGGTVLSEAYAGIADPTGITKISAPSLPVLGVDGASVEVRVGADVESFPVVAPEKVLAALELASRALAMPPAPPDGPKGAGLTLADLRLDVELRVSRLRAFVSEADADRAALDTEADELASEARALTEGHPLEKISGARRHAMRSRADDRTTELGLYVPPAYAAQVKSTGTARPFPLVVALHGLNGKPLQMVRWFFGKDDPGHDGAWEDRHMPPLEALPAFVLAPSGHGNGMYRELAEEDVMQAIAWVKERFPIDPSRVSITGPSMGGIGAAGIPLRRPWVFSAAAPLCGYHSTFVRRDVAGKRLSAWERFLGEDRSNADWAANGRGLPLYIVHGTQDLPEENSKVLIDKYEALHYPVKHEHPDLGHNVWQTTYEKPETAKWLLSRQTQLHPKWVLFRTARTRWSDSAWVHVRQLAKSDAWGEVRAHAASRTRIEATTTNVSAIVLDRDEKLFDADAALEVALDGKVLTFPKGAPIELVRTGAGWEPGKPKPGEKAGALTGPFRDVFHEPLVFVYGTRDPKLRIANERVARGFAQVRFGVTASYPILSDTEALARDVLGTKKALFLVGSSASNALTAKLEATAPFPIRADGQAIVVGSRRFEGREAGAAFVRPNPAAPDRYVAVVLSPTPEGTLRALSLPDLLPDFVVYDEKVAPARGQLVLGSASLRAAGFFGLDWSLPAL